MGLFSRLPTSNNSLKGDEAGNRWLETNEIMDEVALLLAGLAKRCVQCRRATSNKYLDSKQICPSCRH